MGIQGVPVYETVLEYRPQPMHPIVRVTSKVLGYAWPVQDPHYRQYSDYPRYSQCSDSYAAGCAVLDNGYELSVDYLPLGNMFFHYPSDPKECPQPPAAKRAWALTNYQGKLFSHAQPQQPGSLLIDTKTGALRQTLREKALLLAQV